jgi:hypothetical protein
MRGRGRPAGEGGPGQGHRGIGMRAGRQLETSDEELVAYPRWRVLLGILGIIFTSDG